MPPQSIVVIRSPAELSRLAQRGGVALRRRTVVLELAGLDPAEARGWERRLNRETRACGCDAGAGGLVAGIGLLLVYALTHPAGFATAPARTGIASAIVLVGLALVGKTLGLLAARGRLSRALRELQQSLERPVG